MKNEPVAWIDKNTGKPRMEGFIQTDYDIPLYIHPAKTLTDEEILALWTQKNNLNGAKDVIDFARAIMKRCGIIDGTDK